MASNGLSKIICLCSLFVALCSCGTSTPKEEQAVVEDSLVWYPGRTFSYKTKFNDLQVKQHAVASQIGLPRPPKDRADAASMRNQLVEIKTNENYIVEELTHSVPYLIPSAKKELDAIGAEWADILARNGLPPLLLFMESVICFFCIVCSARILE